MANIRINSLPATATVLPDDVLPMDGATTRKIKPSDLLTSIRPFATQPEAEAGVNSTSAMSPLTTAQAIAAQLPSTAAGKNLLAAADPAAQRGLLGLGGAAMLAVGTAAGTVAAGDDSRITGSAQKSANLSDLASASTARTNLGLGGSAVRNVGTTAGTVAAGDDIRFAGVAGIVDQATAEAGVNNTGIMSPLRTKQAIDANASAILATGAVRFDAAQTLSSPQKAQAQTNIGVDTAAIAGSVRFDAVQALSDPQKLQARTNIGFGQGVAAYVVPTRAEIGTTSIPAVLNFIGAAGYYASGDCGAVLPFKRVATPSPVKRWHVQSADGAWWELSVTQIDPRMLGAKFTGSASDSATNILAVNAALDYHDLGGTVIIPPGRCYIQQDGANPWCMKQVKPNRVIGAGAMYSALIPVSGTAGSVDTFAYYPDPALAHREACIKGVFLGDSFTGDRKGRAGIYIYTSNAGVNVSGLEISGNCIGQNTTAGQGHYSIWHYNEIATVVEGGLYSCRIEGNSLTGGIQLTGSGDSNHIERNTITDLAGNATVGVFFSLIAGASELTIIGNNITTRGGAIVGDSGSRTKILFNNIEQVVSGATDNAMINLRGLGGTMVNCEIHGNHLGAFSGTGVTANVRLRNQIAPKVTHNNMLAASGSTFAIDIANVVDGVYSPNTIGTGGAGKITAGAGATGIGGIFVQLAVTGSWTTPGSAGYSPVGYVKNGATVTLTGTVTAGSAGTTLATLPVGCRPPYAISMVAYKGTGLGVVTILADGSVVATDLAVGGFNSFNVTFPVAGDSWSSSDL